MGLSPRTRGNPDVELSDEVRQGSIPAHAGEPHLSLQMRESVRVYPRARGGTR